MSPPWRQDSVKNAYGYLMPSRVATTVHGKAWGYNMQGGNTVAGNTGEFLMALHDIFGRIVGNTEVGHSVADYLARNPYATPDELTASTGIDREQATTILMVMENSAEYLAGTSVSPIVNPEDAARYFMGLRFSQQEKLAVLTLDSANHPIRATVVTEGILNHAPAHPREVFRQAILDNAASIIIAHNHPSGCLSESRDDIALTNTIVAAGKVVMINVLDHLVISRSGLLSLRNTHPELFA